MYIRIQGKAVKVCLDAKPFAKLTPRRTQPSIAGVRLVILVAVQN